MDTSSNFSDCNETELLDQFNHITLNISKCDPFAEKIMQKDIVILLGNTKAGKSSLCHYIIGNPLIAVKGKRPRTFEVAAVEGYEGPTIGKRVTAETTLPTIWFPARINEVLVDAPGFGDNRGEAQDIVNSFYIKKMIGNAKSVKFMLICDINDILSHNINNFITLVDKVYAMLPVLEDLQRSMCLVFSKENENLSANDMRERMREIHNEDKICIKKSILESFISCNSNIVFFHAPGHEGPINEDIGIDVINVINSLTAVPCNSLPVITPALSDKSRVFLLFAEKQLSEKGTFFTIIEMLTKELEAKVKVGAIHDTVTAEKRKGELLDLQKNIGTARRSVENNANLLNIADALKELSSSCLRDRIACGDLKAILQFVEFVDDILHRPLNPVFRMQFNMLIDRILAAIEHSLAQVQEVLKSIAQREHENKIREQTNCLNRETQKCAEKIQHLEETIHRMRTNRRRSSGSCIIS